MVPGSQTFEQALYRLYDDKIITLDEALNNADSANNLQQVINNATKKSEPVAADNQSEKVTHSVAPGTSFSDFTLKMDD